jgi:D-glycero-D-manno-heptose 1,7-bisphosphate phosphatase
MMFCLERKAISAVFLDRDGTINVKAAEGDYITSPDKLALLPGSAQAVAALNAAGLTTILITNQRWLSRSSANMAQYATVHDRLERLLAYQGARLDASYYCSHAASSCFCRKPAPGMLYTAALEHQLDLSMAVMVGDSSSDILAGKAAGTATILLRSQGSCEPIIHADAVTIDLPSAVRLILGCATVACSGLRPTMGKH